MTNVLPEDDFDDDFDLDQILDMLPPEQWDVVHEFIEKVGGVEEASDALRAWLDDQAAA